MSRLDAGRQPKVCRLAGQNLAAISADPGCRANFGSVLASVVAVLLIGQLGDRHVVPTTTAPTPTGPISVPPPVRPPTPNAPASPAPTFSPPAFSPPSPLPSATGSRPPKPTRKPPGNTVRETDPRGRADQQSVVVTGMPVGRWLAHRYREGWTGTTR